MLYDLCPIMLYYFAANIYNKVAPYWALMFMHLSSLLFPFLCSNIVASPFGNITQRVSNFPLKILNLES